ncbi:hypothetical protein SFC65_19380 [Priestia filamentosa]|uniref:hypothetical protein n=1 Tax=Priestia filamentosa TaxID=1402861 RepID=UPI003982553B
MSKKRKELPLFLQKEMEGIDYYKGKCIEFPLTNYCFNFWSLDPEKVFSTSPLLQEEFIKLRNLKGKWKRGVR